tara:strand:+ start:3417 stop:4994 length:1578 start_codon:yes stop_codon:yes gene_type:complete
MSKISFRKIKKGLKRTSGLGAAENFWDAYGEDIQYKVSNFSNEITNKTNTVSKSGEAEGYKGQAGDIKINKTGENKYDFYIRGEDGWHKDNNASFGPIDATNQVNDPPTVNMTSGQFDYSYEGNPRLSLNLDPTKISSGSVATPTIKGFGNLKLESTGTTIVQSALQMNTVPNAGSDVDKFLVVDGSGKVKHRTGAEVLSDIGGISTDTTLTDEQVQDIVGAMVSGNTETNINVTYDDSSGKLDFASTDTNTTYDVMASGNSYAAGLVAAGSGTHSNQFLRKDGTWVVPTDTDTNTNQLTIWNYQIDSGSTVDVAHGQTLQMSSGNGIELSEDAAREFTVQAVNASASAKGVVELATTAETTTGTDATRAVTPDGLKDSGYMGHEFRHIINAGFNYNYTAGTKVYIPLVGYIIERNSQLASNEYLSYVAPYDGYLKQVIIRSEEACGSTVVGFHKSSTGTEHPAAIPSRTAVVDMAADDTSYKFEFLVNNTFSAGDIINISFDPTNDANDVVFTVEFILDSSAGL